MATPAYHSDPSFASIVLVSRETSIGTLDLACGVFFFRFMIFGLCFLTLRKLLAMVSVCLGVYRRMIACMRCIQPRNMVIRWYVH